MSLSKVERFGAKWQNSLYACPKAAASSCPPRRRLLRVPSMTSAICALICLGLGAVVAVQAAGWLDGGRNHSAARFGYGHPASGKISFLCFRDGLIGKVSVSTINHWIKLVRIGFNAACHAG